MGDSGSQGERESEFFPGFISIAPTSQIGSLSISAGVAREGKGHPPGPLPMGVGEGGCIRMHLVWV